MRSKSAEERLRRGTHVVVEGLLQERLEKMGAQNVVPARDRLVIGPSRRDPAEHASARHAWWPEDLGFDQLYAPTVRWTAPVIVWTSSSIVERLDLWRTCHWLRQRDWPASDLLFVETERVRPAASSFERTAVFNSSTEVGDHPDHVLLERLAAATEVSQQRYDAIVGLWTAFTSPDPRPFVQACLEGVEGAPEAGPLWAFLSYFFPRRGAAGGVLLSRFDELVLRILSPEWKTPVKVFVHRSPEGKELIDVLMVAGDLFLARRLEDWAHHRGGNAVERGPGTTPDTMLRHSYRIGQLGIRLRDEGMLALDEAPPLPVGGTEAYSPASPWVLEPDGRIAPL